MINMTKKSQESTRIELELENANLRAERNQLKDSITLLKDARNIEKEQNEQSKQYYLDTIDTLRLEINDLQKMLYQEQQQLLTITIENDQLREALKESIEPQAKELAKQALQAITDQMIDDYLFNHQVIVGDENE